MRRQLCLHFVEHLLIIIGITTLTCGLVPAHNLNNRHATIHSTTNQARILASTTTDDTDAATTIVNEQLTKQLGSAFTQKLTELEEYKKKHGNCLVPRRYEENPSLGNFVNKQRQSYRKFLMGEKSSMNDVSPLYVVLQYVCFFNHLYVRKLISYEMITDGVYTTKETYKCIESTRFRLGRLLHTTIKSQR